MVRDYNKRRNYKGIEKSKIKMFKKMVVVLGSFFILVVAYVVLSNMFMVKIQGKKIVSEEEAKNHNAQCILILGAGVWSDSPSPMLEDRLLEGINLYHQGAASKIIVSGDHGRENYDEVNVMKQYLVDAGIPDTDIFMDHAGFSTYESIVRAKKVFNVERMVVVSQKYHLYRALYICGKKHIDAVGVNSDPRRYAGQSMRDIRELVARDKDIFTCLLGVKPKYLGDAIDISGDGNVTND